MPSAGSKKYRKVAQANRFMRRMAYMYATQQCWRPYVQERRLLRRGAAIDKPGMEVLACTSRGPNPNFPCSRAQQPSATSVSSRMSTLSSLSLSLPQALSLSLSLLLDLFALSIRIYIYICKLDTYIYIYGNIYPSFTSFSISF